MSGDLKPCGEYKDRKPWCRAMSETGRHGEDKEEKEDVCRSEILKGKTPRGYKPPSQFLSSLMRNQNEEAAFRNKIAKRLKKKRKSS
jgi:hypothetical protein